MYCATWFVVWFNDTQPLSMVKTLKHQKVAHLSDASAAACHLSSVRTSTLAFLPHQGKQTSSQPLRSQTLKWEFPSKLRYLRFPSIVLPLSNHFHTKGAKPKLFSCQQQQLPWQHTGRSALWDQDASVKKKGAIRATFCSSCSSGCPAVIKLTTLQLGDSI